MRLARPALNRSPFSPKSRGPVSSSSSIKRPTLVLSSYSSRSCLASCLPSRISDRPAPYCGAVSKKRVPCCQAASTVAAASSSVSSRNMFPSGAAPKPNGPLTSLSRIPISCPLLGAQCGVEPVEHHRVSPSQRAGVGVFSGPFCHGQGDPGGFGCGEGLFDAFGLALEHGVVLAFHDQGGGHDLIGHTVEGVVLDGAQHVGIALNAKHPHAVSQCPAKL